MRLEDFSYYYLKQNFPLSFDKWHYVKEQLLNKKYFQCKEWNT